MAGYLGWLRSRTESIELRGIELAGGAPVVRLPLETAYVALRAKAMPRLAEAQARMRGGGRTYRGRDGDVADTGPSEGESDIALNQVLELGNRLVIVGGPGSGKTTVLLHMAWALASSLLGGESEPASSSLGLKMAPSGLPLPIFVPLASFARYRRYLPGNAPAGETTLACFISHHDFGLYDMIGDLWEWTRSLWGKDRENPEFVYPYQPADPKREDLDAGDEVRRVVRGGSWYRFRGYARCACRYGDPPEFRHDLLGFRVVLRSAPVS